MSISDERLGAIFRSLAKKCRIAEKDAIPARVAHRDYVAGLLDDIAARIEAEEEIDAVPAADIIFSWDGAVTMSELEILAQRTLGAVIVRPAFSIPQTRPATSFRPPAALAVLVVAFMALGAVAPSHGRELYPGQYAQYSPEERAWFKGVRSPKGMLCCDVADGHRTTWRAGPDGYEVPIADDAGTVHWRPVPPDALVENADNPTHDAIVWYRDYGPQFPDDTERYLIRCFVPGNGA